MCAKIIRPSSAWMVPFLKGWWQMAVGRSVRRMRSSLSMWPKMIGNVFPRVSGIAVKKYYILQFILP